MIKNFKKIKINLRKKLFKNVAASNKSIIHTSRKEKNSLVNKLPGASPLRSQTSRPVSAH